MLNRTQIQKHTYAFLYQPQRFVYIYRIMFSLFFSLVWAQGIRVYKPQSNYTRHFMPHRNEMLLFHLSFHLFASTMRSPFTKIRTNGSCLLEVARNLICQDILDVSDSVVFFFLGAVVGHCKRPFINNHSHSHWDAFLRKVSCTVYLYPDERDRDRLFEWNDCIEEKKKKQASTLVVVDLLLIPWNRCNLDFDICAFDIENENRPVNQEEVEKNEQRQTTTT